jgi:hypothetical protein
MLDLDRNKEMKNAKYLKELEVGLQNLGSKIFM